MGLEFLANSQKNTTTALLWASRFVSVFAVHSVGIVKKQTRKCVSSEPSFGKRIKIISSIGAGKSILGNACVDSSKVLIVQRKGRFGFYRNVGLVGN